MTPLTPSEASHRKRPLLHPTQRSKRVAWKLLFLGLAWLSQKQKIQSAAAAAAAASTASAKPIQATKKHTASTKPASNIATQRNILSHQDDWGTIGEDTNGNYEQEAEWEDALHVNEKGVKRSQPPSEMQNKEKDSLEKVRVQTEATRTASPSELPDDNKDYPVQDILVVSAVDGTLAGVSRSTGKTLWKRSAPTMFSLNDEQLQSDAPLFQPLVSTTTTIQMDKTEHWKTSAVPSIDGKVHLTAPLHDQQQNHQSDDQDDDQVTVTTTVSELVARSPFLDNRGRIYTGTRKSVAAAIDGSSGRVLQMISSEAQCSVGTPFDEQQTQDQTTVVWLGRVDYDISIQDPRSGLLDVQFSSGQIMSVKDMLLGNAPGSTSPQSQEQQPWYGQQQPFMLPEGVDNEGSPVLLATPNGVLAYGDPNTGKIAWVSQEYFESPIAFCIDGASGSSLPVSIVSDALIATGRTNENNQDLAQEFERQLELAASSEDKVEEHQRTIFSQITSSGQLFAMPLGIQQSKSQKEQQKAIAASERNENTRDYYSKQCHPGASNCYPEDESSFQHKFLDSPPQQQEQTQDLPTDGAVIPFYHPDLGYIPPEHFYTLKHQDERKHYKKMFKILGSWLPPTIALIFVMSFELGRRKRQKDSKLTATNADLVNSSVHGAVAVNDNGVIQVCDDVILGYGGHGTVVFRGILDGRQVAVKRMLKAYHASADREISLLIESDGHVNVVRYFLKEVRGDFVYLALELCDLSLHDLIGTLRNQNDGGHSDQETFPASLKTILFQIACGVRHLHHLRIVHRDLKPANILLADSRRTKKTGKLRNNDDRTVYEIFVQGHYVAKISDMGLGKQLAGQSSFGASLINDSSFRGASTTDKGSIAGAGPGSVGWQAPEVMARRTPTDGSVKSGEGSNTFDSVSDSGQFEVSSSNSTSRSVDIFSLGCIFYSTLVPGSHPFGEWYEREANIMHNRPNIEVLKSISVDAHDLIAAMIQRNPLLRPTAKQICEHPFFWSLDRRLSFICEFSDRLEMECDGSTKQAAKLLAVEQGAVQVVGVSWDRDLDTELVSNVQKFRTYDPSSVRDLLRLIRNKTHHFDELSTELKESLLCTTEGLMEYFEKRFPVLLIHCFRVCRELLPVDDQLSLKYSIAPYGSKRKQTAVPVICEASQATSSTISEEPAIQDEQEDVGNGSCELICEQTQQRTRSSSHESVVSVEDIPTIRNEPQVAPDPTGTNTSASSQKDPLSRGSSSTPPLIGTTRTGSSETTITPSSIGDVIAWHGSDAAKTLNCRGWSRSDEEWIRRVDTSLRKRTDATLVRCKEDPKFRTRLCNHWDVSLGTFCPMLKKKKCDFAHGPVELRVKEAKRNRWGKLVDANGDNKNLNHSGGEDTYGAARNIETTRKQEGKWNTENGKGAGTPRGKSRGTGGSGRKKKQSW